MMTAVQGRAPAGIQWLGDGSKVLGTGATQLKVPVGTKQIVALDKKRGGRSIVPIKGNIADYGALPRAKVHPRANPYADVYLGSEKLGTTPFAPVEVVVGKYTLRFVKGKSEQKRTVDVKPGDIVRVIVDFTGK